jgi:hypothetical protein
LTLVCWLAEIKTPHLRVRDAWVGYSLDQVREECHGMALLHVMALLHRDAWVGYSLDQVGRCMYVYTYVYVCMYMYVCI